MVDKLIKFKRGNKSNLPQLNEGEPAIVTDESEVYVGFGANGERVRLRKYDYDKRGFIHVVAHRGRFFAPENSIMGLSMLPDGVKGVEVDVRFTSDDEPVLIHDATVDRTTDGTGNVDSFTLSGIQALDAGSYLHSNYSGVRVPHLEDYLKRARMMNFQMIMLDIKVLDNATHVNAIKTAIQNANMEERTMLLFNYTADADLWLANDNYIRFGFLNAGSITPVSTLIEYCQKYDGELIYLGGGQTDNYKDLIIDIHDANLLAGGSIANDPNEILPIVRDYGLDVIMTDSAGTYTNLIKRGHSYA